MAAPKMRVYIAASLDGYIADAQGSVGWLEPFEGQDFGYAGFIASVDRIIMGRTTFEQARTFGEWPYPGKRTVVLTHGKPPPCDIPGVSFIAGEPRILTEELLRQARRDVWVLGGGRTIRGFLDAGCIDTFELFLMPRLLGNGVRLFPESGTDHTLTLRAHRTYPKGVVGLVYAVAAHAPAEMTARA